MKLIFKNEVPAIICAILLSCIQYNKILAQDKTHVKEPPIPVYIICPYHEDSLRAVYEGSIQGNGSTFISAAKKYDTLQQQVQKSSAESTVHFIWLYALVALLGIMDMVLLFSTSRIKKELAQMKRLEQHQLLLTSEPPVISQPFPKILEASFKQEPAQLQAPVRTRKVRTMKPRVKRRK